MTESKPLTDPPTYHQIIAGMVADLFGGTVTFCAARFPKEFYFCSHKGIATIINFEEAIAVIRKSGVEKGVFKTMLDVPLPECLEIPKGVHNEAPVLYSMLHAVLKSRFSETNI